MTGFSLNYFSGDYNPVSGGVNPFPAHSGWFKDAKAYKPLFNGNISSMARTNAKLAEFDWTNGGTILYNYGYDQLNRLTQMDAFNQFNVANNRWDSLQSLVHWKERIAYDANGNILKYKRNGAAGFGLPAEMDSLSYQYYAGTNRLKRIRDSVPAGVYPNNVDFSDLDSQIDSNYVYDEIGNLIKDSSEKITNIKWSVYGKILQITRQATSPTAATRIVYSYDAQGNRISKTTEYGGNNYKKLEWYVRDAQGNVMAIYFAEGALNTLVNGLEPKLSERHIYGSSLLGTYNNQEGLFFGPNRVSFVSSFTYVRGLRRYQLSNHLGNVEAVITDKKYGVPSGSNSSLIEYYKPDITMVQDFYPFGWPMPGRTWETQLYRYGFNGQQVENEISGKWNHTTAEFWEYDPRAGRRWNLDPKPTTGISQYSAILNNPIWFNDPLGDSAPAPERSTFGQKGYVDLAKYKAGSLPYNGNILNKANAVANNFVLAPLSNLSIDVIDGISNPGWTLYNVKDGIVAGLRSVGQWFRDNPDPVQGASKLTSEMASYAKENLLNPDAHVQFATMGWSVFGGSLIGTNINLTKNFTLKSNAGQVSAIPEETATLYRNFGWNEYNSIKASGGNFSIHPNYFQGKQFWVGESGLEMWNKSGFAKPFTAKLTVPKSFVTPGHKNYIFMEADMLIDGFPGGTVLPANLNLFNSVKKIEYLRF